MERAVEWFVAITSLVIGASHILRADDWANTYRRLHQLGTSGAFLNGTLSLLTGAVIVAGHRVWTFPAAVVTVFGWLSVVKGAVCFLFPEKALRSMERGGQSPKDFVAAGVLVLVIGCWAFACLWWQR